MDSCQRLFRKCQFFCEYSDNKHEKNEKNPILSKLTL